MKTYTLLREMPLPIAFRHNAGLLVGTVRPDEDGGGNLPTRRL